MRLHDLPIKWKLVLTIVAVSVAVLVIEGGALFLYDYRSVAEWLERDLETTAGIAAANSTAALYFEDPKTGAETLAALAAKPAIDAACLYDPQGRAFAIYMREGTQAALPEHPGADGFDRGEEHLIFTGPVAVKGERIGTILVRSDRSPLREWLATYGLVVGGIVLLAVLLAVGLASLLQRPFLAPVLDLAQTARRVSQEKDYALRGVKHGEDEFGFLIDRFNEMLAQIQERDNALVRAREELEDRVATRTRDLQESNRELEAFSYSVAHDLRSPLRGIDGFSLVLMEDYGDKLDAQGLEHLKRIRTATQRMAELLDDMLKLSKVTRSSLNVTTVGLSEMARSVVADLRRLHPERPVEFEMLSELTVKGDEGLLRIALENLIGNAWKFTSKRERPRVELGKVNTGTETIYFVRDNGAGFDPAYSNKLFGVFQRLHTASEFPGTGVGLATVQRIVHKHGGRIWAESEQDRGATFYFTLPA
ncbi:MAG: HAMP domain-containing protein [Planctomycetes bacterium]|nr:HAMP domain-containing protein [Planctomycetota bacterium]